MDLGHGRRNCYRAYSSLLKAPGNPKKTYWGRRARQKHHHIVFLSINFQYSMIYVSE